MRFVSKLQYDLQNIIKSIYNKVEKLPLSNDLKLKIYTIASNICIDEYKNSSIEIIYINHITNINYSQYEELLFNEEQIFTEKLAYE
jgi:hypothetical protein